MLGDHVITRKKSREAEEYAQRKLTKTKIHTSKYQRLHSAIRCSLLPSTRFFFFASTIESVYVELPNESALRDVADCRIERLDLLSVAVSSDSDLCS